MSQTYTDDCFASGHVGQTDLQNIENNFAALKSSFSGASAPPNAVAGMGWFDTDTDQLYLRNKNNNKWLSLGFVPGTIMLFGQNSAPLGWTRKTDWSDHAMLCYSASGDITSGGTANPQSVHTHVAGSLIHAHTHSVSGTSDGPSATHGVVDSQAQYNTPTSDHSHTFSCTSGGASSDSITGSTGDNTIPLYQEVIACTKD